MIDLINITHLCEYIIHIYQNPFCNCKPPKESITVVLYVIILFLMGLNHMHSFCVGQELMCTDHMAVHTHTGLSVSSLELTHEIRNS